MQMDGIDASSIWIVIGSGHFKIVVSLAGGFGTGFDRLSKQFCTVLATCGREWHRFVDKHVIFH